MSHAPVCRKSQKALAAAASIAASTKPAPHLVVLRVKRKRGDASVDSLLVSTDEAASNENHVPDRKRRAGTETIEDTLAFLSINKAAENGRQHHVDQKPSRLFYKRVRTTESDRSDRKKTTSIDRVVAPPKGEHSDVVETAGTGGGPLDTRLVSDADASVIPPPPDALDYLEVRRIKARAIGTATDSGRGSGHGVPSSSDLASGASDFHVIDLQAVGRGGNSMLVTGTGDTTFGGKTAANSSAAPVLNPVERQMDEAIFKAFQTGDLSSLHSILASNPSTINFRRRLGDGTTALMAAAFHGNVDAVRHLLSLGAKASLADAGGKSAALIAGMRGHRTCFAELQRAADEERSAGSRRKGGGHEDFVYDLYYFEPPTPRSPAARGGETVVEGQAGDVAPGKIGEKTSDTSYAPVVRLSGIGPVDENAVWTTGIELKFEHDSDWSELGDGDEGEDPDSNSEGFYGNDYPEDEGDNDCTGGAYICAGSSCPSEDGSSSDGRLDSDNDVDPRRVLHAHDSAFDRLADVASFSGNSEDGLEQTVVASEGVRTNDNPFRTGLGDAEALAYSPQPSNDESDSDDL